MNPSYECKIISRHKMTVHAMTNKPVQLLFPALQALILKATL